MSKDKDGKPKLGSKRGALAGIGSLEHLQKALWQIISKLKAEISDQGTLIEVLPLKAVHSLATLAGVYCRLHEVADLESRLSALEQQVLEKDITDS
jgi:hypothetical protein